MVTKNRMTEIKNMLDVLLLPNSKVGEDKMFGYPGYYINGNLFACIYEDSITVKLPVEKVTEYIGDKNIEQLVMMGKKMKEWIRITEKDLAAYLDYQSILQDSIQFVSVMKPKKRKK